MLVLGSVRILDAPRKPQTSSLPLNQWRFVSMYVHDTICLRIHPQLH